MLSDKLVIGQYYPAKSYFHSRDARAKIITSVIYLLLLFVVKDWASYALLTAVLLAHVKLSNIPASRLLSGMKTMLIFFVGLTALLNAFFMEGETVLWSWSSLTLTLEGLLHGLKMGLRLLLLILYASLLTLTTTPIELTDAIERLLSPLARLGVPAHEIAMMMSIALRFIPTILEEFDRIVLAQRSRGADIGSGGLFKQAKALLPLLVPLFVAAFRRAEELAQAMEAKCYHGGEGRTHWRRSRWQSGDTQLLLIYLLLAAALIGWRVLGGAF